VNPLINKVGEVKLAHLSIKDYLLSEQICHGVSSCFRISETIAHAYISQTCLAYLLQFKRLDALNPSNIGFFPLAQYAAQYWIFHLQSTKSVVGFVVQQLIMDLLQSVAFINWICLWDLDGHRTNLGKCWDSMASPLYYASHAGLHHAVQGLLEKRSTGRSTGNAQKELSDDHASAWDHALL
jgi:hypothetical protein